MKMVENTTDYPDSFLRKMVTWVRKQAELPPKEIWGIGFKNTSFSFSGTAWRNRFVVIRIGPESRYPMVPYYDKTKIPRWLNRRIEALVFVTAHEVMHLRQFSRERKQWPKKVRRDAYREQEPNLFGNRVLLEFLRNENKLIPEWSVESKRMQKAACRSKG